MGGGSSSWSPSGWADLVFIERGPGSVQCLDFVIQFANSIVDRLHDFLGCSHAPDATHARGAPTAGRALHVSALRRGGNPIGRNPRICWRVPMCSDIDDTTKTIPARASRTVDCGEEGDPWVVVVGRASGGRSAPITGVPTMEEELRGVRGAAVYDELAAYCRARQNGERCRVMLLPMIV